MRLRCRTRFGLHLAAVLLSPSGARAQLVTSQYDNARTGAYLDEHRLSPANVNAERFGKLYALRVDGDLYAQPLYLKRLNMPGRGVHDVLYVATESDHVYAFDALDPKAPPLWHVQFANADKGVTPLDDRDVQCPFIKPVVGISATPVIDTVAGTLFVLARTKEAGTSGARYVQRLHALDVRTGAERAGSPVEIQAAAPGSASDAVNGQVRFDPLRENPRAAMLLVDGRVVLSWASSCDVGPYHGWIIAYDAKTLAQVAAFNTTPDGVEGGVWQGHAGLAADDAGNVFAVTGNGTFSASGTNGHDYGNSVLKLSITGKIFTVADFFTPHDEARLSAQDLDLGSGGPVLLPPRNGDRSGLLVTGGKAGTVYVLDRNHLGHFSAAATDPHALQTFHLAGMVMGAPAFWNGRLYYFTSDDVLRSYALQAGERPLRLTGVGSVKFTDPGATPVVSASGATNGIVWVIESKGWRAADRQAVLHAFDALDVRRELYSSEQNASRDRAGRVLRFSMPTVMDGRVYVGTKGEIDVYGLLATGR
jgi:hypothetical protein